MSLIELNGSKFSRLLSAIHTHADIANAEGENQIVYKEKDIAELLKKLKEGKSLPGDFDVLG